MDKIHAVLDTVREMERSMRVLVKIPRDEEDRIVVNALIRIRKAYTSRNKDMSHFDKVLKHYLGDDGFKKYVIEQHEIEY